MEPGKKLDVRMEAKTRVLKATKIASMDPNVVIPLLNDLGDPSSGPFRAGANRRPSDGCRTAED